MKITDIAVNPGNYSEFDVSPEYGQFHPKYAAALGAHCSLNTYLEEKLNGYGGKLDWGGKYNTWLRQFRIGPVSENGWWSIEAVDPINIQAFVRDYTAESDEDVAWQKKLYDGKKVLELLSSLDIEVKNVNEILEVFSKLQLR